MKRGLSFLLTLALCLSLCPVDALALDLGGAAAVGSEAAAETPAIEAPAVEAPVAEEAAEEAAEESAEEAAADGATSGSCGTNATWTLSGGVLTISGSGNMTNYSGTESLPWTGETITQIVIESGITSIGNYVFSNIGNSVTDVSISSTVTRIGDYAFYLLGGLRSIDLPDGLTYIGTCAFSMCTGLESITVPQNAEIGRCAFSSCDGLKTAGPIGGGYDYEFAWTESIPDNAFFGCSGLTSVVIPETVTTIGENAFCDCSGLQSIEIPDDVNTIGDSAFSHCGLTDINLPSCLTEISGKMLWGCTGLTSIEVPNGVEKIDTYAFWDCSNLETVYIPDTVTEFGYEIFEGCANLSDVYFSGTEAEWDGIVCYEGMSEELESATIHFAETEDPGELTEEEIIHAAYVEYIHEWLLAEMEVNSSMTEEMVDEFMILVEDGRYDEFPAEMLYNGMLVSGKALTLDEFTAQYYTPAAPVFSISTKVSTGKPRLTWDAVDGAVKYEVWRGYSKNGTYYKMGSTSGLSYTNTSAKAGTTYYYKIRAVSSNGNMSDYSTVKNMTCDYARPVVSISCAASTGKPKLTWEAVDGATKYEIWRATSKTGTYSKIYTTSNCYFNNTTAVANKSYYYKVRAIGASSYATSAYSSMVSITCDCAKPVVSISCNASTGKPKLTWSAVSGATKYEIWRATSRTGTYTKIYTTSNTYFNNTTATANKSYYYKVRAIGSSSYATSAYSSIASITCDCARPVVTASTNSSGKPRLSWSAVDGAVKYEIWRSGYRNGTYTKIYTTTNTYFNNTSAGSGYTYFYKVRAVGTSSYATSAFSTILSAKCK